MRVAVFEDNDEKWQKIRNTLFEKGIKENSIIRIDNVAKFATLSGKTLDLCIIDIRMPSVSGGTVRNTGTEILQMLDYSGMQRVPVLAITAYPGEAEELLGPFTARGCIIYDYDRQEVWSQALDIFIAQAREKGRYDFLIFTALKKERDAYLSLECGKIDSVQRNGLDLWEFDLNGRSGAIVLLPRMGLVNATAIVSRALELYTPAVTAMSGICAGLGSETYLGQLLIADVVWEYQSGKWLDEAFEAEPYQEQIPPHTRLEISKILEENRLLSILEANHTGSFRPSKRSPPKLAVFTTGSAVIASEKRLETVKQQHRKVSGLDMEVYGFHRAVGLSGQNVHAFSAKVVVDKANEAKGDDLHEYGSIVSAGFVLQTIQRLLG